MEPTPLTVFKNCTSIDGRFPANMANMKKPTLFIQPPQIEDTDLFKPTPLHLRFPNSGTPLVSCVMDGSSRAKCLEQQPQHSVLMSERMDRHIRAEKFLLESITHTNTRFALPDGSQQ